MTGHAILQDRFGGAQDPPRLSAMDNDFSLHRLQE